MESLSEAGTHRSTLSGPSLPIASFTPFEGSVRIGGLANRRLASISHEGLDDRRILLACLVGR
jgi:hypothetical protein